MNWCQAGVPHGCGDRLVTQQLLHSAQIDSAITNLLANTIPTIPNSLRIQIEATFRWHELDSMTFNMIRPDIKKRCSKARLPKCVASIVDGLCSKRRWHRGEIEILRSSFSGEQCGLLCGEQLRVVVSGECNGDFSPTSEL